MARSNTHKRRREPDVTREKLLRAAFEEIYRRGYQSASLDTILAKARVTKGALYHHFPDKAALGRAVVDEVVSGLLLRRWSVDTLAEIAGDPVTAIQEVIRHRSAELTPREVELGCPLNNLAQEMSPLDERFRRSVNRAFDTWREAFSRALERGQAEGSVRRKVDPRKTSDFIVAAIEGSYGLAKNAQSTAMLRSNLEVLNGFLDTLRPTDRPRKAKRARARI
jgi:TetR/AcrR family transcriptional repressor of nem operon